MKINPSPFILPNRHTFSPKSWNDVKILKATDEVALEPGKIIRNEPGALITEHTKVVDGAEWQVIKENGTVTSSYPTGATP